MKCTRDVFVIEDVSESDRANKNRKSYLVYLIDSKGIGHFYGDVTPKKKRELIKNIPDGWKIDYVYDVETGEFV